MCYSCHMCDSPPMLRSFFTPLTIHIYTNVNFNLWSSIALTFSSFYYNVNVHHVCYSVCLSSEFGQQMQQLCRKISEIQKLKLFMTYCKACTYSLCAIILTAFVRFLLTYSVCSVFVNEYVFFYPIFFLLIRKSIGGFYSNIITWITLKNNWLNGLTQNL